MTAKTLHIEFTRNTMAGGKPVKVGNKATLPEGEARFLIHIGKAKLVTAAPAASVTNAAAPAPSDLEKMKLPALKAFALENKVDVPAGAKKSDILAILAAALAEKAEEQSAETTEETETE